MKHGIDLSHYQHVLNWPLIARTYDFAIFKATEGRHVDSAFAECAAAARDNAMTWGAYHFFRPDVAVADQLNAFVGALDGVAYGEANLFPALDVEPEAGLPFGPAQAADVRAMLLALRERYGRVIVYTSQRAWHMLGNPGVMLDDDVILWVAHYGVAAPACPMGKAWAIWQTGAKVVPGIAGQDVEGVDQNVAAGELPVMRGAAPAAGPADVELIAP